MSIRIPDNFVETMTAEEVKEEVMLIDIDNIRHFPISDSKRMDFYSLWSRFGPQAARDIMIPVVYYGYCPRPSEYFGTTTKANVSTTRS